MRSIFIIFPLASLVMLGCRVFIGRTPEKDHFNNGHGGKGPALAIFGDSLSTGVLATTTLGSVIAGSTLDRFNRMLLNSNFSMRHYQSQFSEYRYSAMTTDLEWGIRQQIADAHKLHVDEIPVFLFSKWGGRTDHLSEFFEEIELVYKNRSPSEYVFVGIGGNDFCKGKNIEEFRKDYKTFLQEVIDRHPHSQIFIADIPPLPQLLNYTHNYSPVLSCRVFRQKFCKRLFYQDAKEYFLKFNLAIREIAAEAMKDKPRIKFSDRPGQMNLDPKDIALDCFHPSQYGHKKLGDFFSNFFK